MAIGAKMSFLKQLEKKLSDTLTVDGMARLLSAVADVAEGFDMQEITAEKEADVQHIHPHKFRRTLATNLHKRGMPIQTIAAILGHESIETTMKYIVLDNNDVKMRYRQCYAVG